MRAMSLTVEESEGEQNELRNLQVQLDSTNRLVQTLSQQLMELKEQVSIYVVKDPVTRNMRDIVTEQEELCKHVKIYVFT